MLLGAELELNASHFYEEALVPEGWGYLGKYEMTICVGVWIPWRSFVEAFVHIFCWLIITCLYDLALIDQ